MYVLSDLILSTLRQGSLLSQKSKNESVFINFIALNLNSQFSLVVPIFQHLTISFPALFLVLVRSSTEVCPLAPISAPTVVSTDPIKSSLPLPSSSKTSNLISCLDSKMQSSATDLMKLGLRLFWIVSVRPSTIQFLHVKSRRQLTLMQGSDLLKKSRSLRLRHDMYISMDWNVVFAYIVFGFVLFYRLTIPNLHLVLLLPILRLSSEHCRQPPTTYMKLTSKIEHQEPKQEQWKKKDINSEKVFVVVYANNNVLMQARTHEQQSSVHPSKPLTSIIFNQHRRAMCALSNSPHKSRNMLQSRTMKQQSPSRITGRPSSKQVPHNKSGKCIPAQRVGLKEEQSQEGKKVNVINLMANGLINEKAKVKSRYCKKITLTNIDQYYEFCLNNMKAMGKPGHKHNPKTQQQHKFSSNVLSDRPATTLHMSKSMQLTHTGTGTPIPRRTGSNLLEMPTMRPFVGPHRQYMSIRQQERELMNLNNLQTNYCSQKQQLQSFRKFNMQGHSAVDLSLSLSLGATHRYSRALRSSDRCCENSTTKKPEFVIDAWESNLGVFDDF